MIANIFTIIAFAIAVYMVTSTIRYIRTSKSTNYSDKVPDHEYTQILERTKPLETNHLPNTGIHYDDETVYLQRASHMGRQSKFFEMLNHS